jgi:hypothetical protein
MEIVPQRDDLGRLAGRQKLRRAQWIAPGRRPRRIEEIAFMYDDLLPIDLPELSLPVLFETHPLRHDLSSLLRELPRSRPATQMP